MEIVLRAVETAVSPHSYSENCKACCLLQTFALLCSHLPATSLNLCDFDFFSFDRWVLLLLDIFCNVYIHLKGKAQREEAKNIISRHLTSLPPKFHQSRWTAAISWDNSLDQFHKFLMSESFTRSNTLTTGPGCKIPEFLFDGRCS